MFFIGASANLFIYLLIPAFVIVCCYGKGISGSPEVNSALTETVAYHPFHQSSERQIFFFQTKKEKTNKEENLSIPIESDNPIIFCSTARYLSPIIQQLYLRAPPIPLSI